ncbi:MAG TPA: HAMP domain-containing histidine kinase, partial [Sulfurovum sp.]|nr:HAMP domain-containing histidine kinase [Sulfurovum sp.]
MSIRTKITLLFLTSLLLMSGMTYWVQTQTTQKNRTILTERYLRAAKTLLSPVIKGDNHKLEAELDELGMQQVEIRKDTRAASILYRQPLSYGEIVIFAVQGNIYLSLTYLDETLTLYDTLQQESRQEQHITYLFFALDIGLLLLIYLLVLTILSPLKHLSRTMKYFSYGDLDVRSKLTGKDEIAELSESFNLMAKRLQHALNAKEELLREVGHELKTPIAKGKFALEGINESCSKTVIKEAFNDLDTLTSAILHQKRIDEEKMYIEKFKASTLITRTLSKLTLNEEDVHIVIEDFEISADLHYMSMALKNLVENALKYTHTLPIEIRASDTCIHIISCAEALDRPLAYYTQPFTRAASDKKGYGLGL